MNTFQMKRSTISGAILTVGLVNSLLKDEHRAQIPMLSKMYEKSDKRPARANNADCMLRTIVIFSRYSDNYLYRHMLQIPTYQ